MEARPEIVAYFSMEMALDPGMPTYCGGLGVLAGDFIRAAADQDLDLVGVTLVHRHGYFSQRIDPSGRQTETPVHWDLGAYCRELPVRIDVGVEGRTVAVRAWQYLVRGLGGHEVPALLLDTDLPGNSDWDRTLTDSLYGGDQRYRMAQEIVLGIGGVRILRALGYREVRRFHMNEGHAALLTLELLDERARAAGRTSFGVADLEVIRRRCVFTTHTPVPAGQDRFPLELARQVLGRTDFAEHRETFAYEGVLNLTYLALSLSHFINGVAKRHGEVSRHLFAGHKIDAITNGVHVATWASPPFAALFDRHIPGWRGDAFSLRYAHGIPGEEIWEAHRLAKVALLNRINHETNAGLTPDLPTLGFARRATAYKRPNLIFTDGERLRRIAAQAGGLQLVFAGKAHPQDEEGKRLIQQIVQLRASLQPDVRLVYLQEYDWELARLAVAGVDVWLNTPLPPMEASGTSGMKAAINGVPSLSVRDGWWIEGCIEGSTGWAIDGAGPIEGDRTRADADSLFTKLEQVVLPLLLHDRERFISMMRHAIALNGSFFNAQRMVLQYVLKAYFE